MTEFRKEPPGRNPFVGGDWGDYHVPIHPASGTNTRDRGGFHFHGGVERGSAGCIDLGPGEKDFYDVLKNVTNDIYVTVNYDNPLAFQWVPGDTAWRPPGGMPGWAEREHHESYPSPPAELANPNGDGVPGGGDPGTTWDGGSVPGGGDPGTTWDGGGRSGSGGETGYGTYDNDGDGWADESRQHPHWRDDPGSDGGGSYDNDRDGWGDESRPSRSADPTTWDGGSVPGGGDPGTTWDGGSVPGGGDPGWGGGSVPGSGDPGTTWDGGSVPGEGDPGTTWDGGGRSGSGGETGYGTYDNDGDGWADESRQHPHWRDDPGSDGGGSYDNDRDGWGDESRPSRGDSSSSSDPSKTGGPEPW